MDAVDWHEAISAQFAQKYASSPAFRERLALWRDLMSPHLRPGVAVLDAGCGPGALALPAAALGASVTAVDASAAMLAVARTRAQGMQIEFLLGRIGDPALLADRRFDLVLCSSVLEYMDDLDAALAWLRLRLAPGGRLLVSMPNGDSWHRRLEKRVYRLTGRPRYYAFVRHAPRVAQFRQTLAAHGLAIEAIRHYGALRLLRALPLIGARADRVEPLFVAVCTPASSE